MMLSSPFSFLSFLRLFILNSVFPFENTMVSLVFLYFAKSKGMHTLYTDMCKTNYDSIYYGTYSYDSYINYFESIKEGRDATFGNIYLKILVSDFNDLQIKYLKHRMENEYPAAINSIETGLNLYKLYLDEYKKKW